MRNLWKRIRFKFGMVLDSALRMAPASTSTLEPVPTLVGKGPPLCERGAENDSHPYHHEGERGPNPGQAVGFESGLNASKQTESDKEGLSEPVGNFKPVQEISDPRASRCGSALAVSVANVKIIDVIRLSDVSTRLRNCVTQANENGELPAQTIGAYIRGLPHSERQFLAIRNFGQRSALELTQLIRKWHEAANAAADPVDFGKRIALLGANAATLLEGAGIIPLSCPSSPDASDFLEARSDEMGRKQRTRICKIFQQVRFPECVLSGDTSTRLRNALHDFKTINEPECPSLGSFLEKPDQWLARLAGQKNVGTGTQEELLTILERIVSGLLIKAGLPALNATQLSAWLARSEKSNVWTALTDKQWESLESFREQYAQFVKETTIEENFDDVRKEIGRDPESGMRHFLEKRLEERYFDVLNRRYGFDRSRRQTLEAIAEGYGVTRERIRQIEVKALGRCRLSAYQNVFRIFLEAQQNEIIAAVTDGGSFVSLDDAAGWRHLLTGLQSAAIKVLYTDFENWLDVHLNPAWRGGRRAGWFVPNLDPAKRHQLEKWIEKNPAGTADLRRRIKENIGRARWPITLSYLRENMPDVSEQRLIRCLRDEFDAELEHGVVTSLKRLPSSIRVILALRDAGRPLHVNELRARHNKLFGVDIDEHAAGAVLQRIEEALIVQRGTYDLYENVGLTSEAIQTIRNVCVTHLGEKGHFLSAKVLRRDIAQQLSQDVNSRLTSYMLLGICQDDPRFAVRRGLMIGLAQEGFEETFTSLNDTVHDVVRQHGPVSIAEISKYMSHQREVLNVSINMVLQSSPEIVMPERGLYDVIERVIGDDTQIERLSNAIQIALIDQPISLTILTSRLAAVGYDLSSATIFSFLRNSGFVSRAGKVFQLTAPDRLVTEYNVEFHKIFDFAKDPEFNLMALTEALRNHESVKLIPLDFRLAMSRSPKDKLQPRSEDDIDFLDELMSEFEF